MINQVIAIIGASENKGVDLVKILARLKSRLLLFGADFHKLSVLIDEIKTEYPDTDVEIIGCPFDASWEADIILLAVSLQEESEILSQIKAVSTQKIVIVLSNQANEPDGHLSADITSSHGEELQKLLPHSKVVQIFDPRLAAGFSPPSVVNNVPDVFITGNDREALHTVSTVLKLAGFNPVVAGDISVSTALEKWQAVIIQLNQKEDT